MGVACGDAAGVARASELAQKLQLPLLEDGFDPRDHEPGYLVLSVAGGIPSLQLTGRRAPGAVGVDFADAAMTHRRRGGQNELLGRAIGWKAERPPRVLDGTAGLGRDAYVLADLGCHVLLCEQHPVLAAILDDAIERLCGAGDPRLKANGERMALRCSDVRQLPEEALLDCEVIYLDPMFSDGSRDRGKALPGKEMQVLQCLHGTDAADDSVNGRLLAWAREMPVKRIVVKRPRHAPPLPGPVPGHALTGKAIRFDVYPLG